MKRSLNKGEENLKESLQKKRSGGKTSKKGDWRGGANRRTGGKTNSREKPPKGPGGGKGGGLTGGERSKRKGIPTHRGKSGGRGKDFGIGFVDLGELGDGGWCGLEESSLP